MRNETEAMQALLDLGFKSVPKIRNNNDTWYEITIGTQIHDYVYSFIDPTRGKLILDITEHTLGDLAIDDNHDSQNVLLELIIDINDRIQSPNPLTKVYLSVDDARKSGTQYILDTVG